MGSVGIPRMEQSLPSDTAELSNTLEEYKQRRCKLQNGNDISLYGILELEPTCAQSDVRKSYYHFSRILHPDKCQDHSAASLLNDVQMAYTILCDDYKRVLYDIKNGFSTGDQLQAQMSALQQGLKERYMQFLNERQMNYIASVGQEYRLRGLVIQKAIYGDLSLKEPNKLVSMETITEQHLKGPFIDVTVQLQLLCVRGTLNVNSGGPMSYAFLPGFYNPLEIATSDLMPCFEVDAQLYVLYLFKGDVHEVTISDGTPFKLPMRTHRVYGSYIKGPYADGNLAVLVHGDSTHR
uniref:J domain-containing protein n=1 Tax=Babesia bovis TaxID=5865 RepID=S6C8V8_BABBO|nr:conserved hypothetical protein [Babesia bovis]